MKAKILIMVVLMGFSSILLAQPAKMIQGNRSVDRNGDRKVREVKMVR